MMVGCSGKKAEEKSMKADIIPFPEIKAPVAAIEPTVLEKHGVKRTDNYFWLKNRESQKVIDYLNAENAYLDSMMSATKAFETKLFDEMKGRIEQNDESAPFFENGYWYGYKYVEGKEYTINYRKKGTLEAPEELLLDCNERATGKSYYDDGGLEVSTDNKIMAFSEDVVGRRFYNVYFKDLVTGQLLKDVIENTTGGVVWAEDNKTVFYSKQDPVTLRSDKIYKHILGTDPKKDALVYTEKDVKYSCGIGKTKDKKYLVVYAGSTLSTEMHLLEANNPNGKFKVFLPRENDHLYQFDYFNGVFYIKTNWQAKNYRIMTVKEGENYADKSLWKEFIAHRPDVLVEYTDVFKNFLVVGERKEGLLKIRIKKWDNSDDHYVDFGEPTYAAYPAANPEINSDVLRFSYTSLTTPSSVYDYDMVSKKRTLIKQRKIVGGYNPEDYQSERIYATAADGTKIPISLVYKKGFNKDGNAPVLQYAYGSYGASMDATFSSARLSLLDRGFCYALCHIRGGEEMGRQWYEDGKLLKKKNTFTDFIDCGKFLIDQKFTNPEKLFAMGGSAGGLLMGAVANMAPKQYKGIVAQVPFVDVVTTMLDETIPLTTGEYDEWGNPNDKQYFDYMLSYSPYDNVVAQEYPNMLVTTGLHDSQVQYWEPAKWVAKLRATKKGNQVVFLYTNMDAGHGGASGRFEALKEVAREYHFMFRLLGINQ